MHWVTCALLTALAMSQAPLSSAAPPFEQPRGFAFLQNRGGIAIAPVERKNGDWLLPVQCNVSGIKTITVAPSVIHASLAWSKSVARIEENTIYLQVYTAMQGSRAPSAECGPAQLRRARPGSYQVYYLDPAPEGEDQAASPPAERLHLLDTITIR
jgi:hypothetical protein